MFVKICGIREFETALAVARAGADAIGLNFFAGSPRVVAPPVAAEIVARLRDLSGSSVEPIGVFVNHTVDEIRTIGRQCRLRTIQLHGDEPPELIAAIGTEFRIVRAFRVGADGVDPLSTYLGICQRLGARPWACLVDAQVAEQYGGTGHTAPWELLARKYKSADWPPLILAGGLRPDNVAEALRVVHPWGVDVASGVESAVACKDAALVRQFVQNAKSGQ